MMTSGDIPAIKVSGLTCGYGDTVLLDALNFSVGKGEIFFIIGGSGCGKSTLLRHLVGLHAPMAGEVKYFGESFTGADTGRQREFLQTFGVLYQGGALWSSLTLRENVALPLIEYTTLTPSERDEIVGFKLAQVGLAGFENHYPAEISGGMKKRAAIARAIALNPKYLFCDEPNSGLDPQTGILIDDLIKEITMEYNITTIVNTHDMNSVLSIGDKVIFVYEGEKGWEGTKEEILHTSNVALNNFVFATNMGKKIKSLLGSATPGPI